MTSTKIQIQRKNEDVPLHCQKCRRLGDTKMELKEQWMMVHDVHERIFSADHETIHDRPAATNRKAIRNLLPTGRTERPDHTKWNLSTKMSVEMIRWQKWKVKRLTYRTKAQSAAESINYCTALARCTEVASCILAVSRAHCCFAKILRKLPRLLCWNFHLTFTSSVFTRPIFHFSIHQSTRC